jgi:two-component sensor histidine kinase
MGAARDTSIDVKTDFDDIRLNPDQAVPLSLFVTEAMTNALKYLGGINGSKPALHVVLREVGEGRAEVQISNSVSTESATPDQETSSGLGSELMEAFAEQLDGAYSADREGDLFVVSLKFPIEELSPKA